MSTEVLWCALTGALGGPILVSRTEPGAAWWLTGPVATTGLVVIAVPLHGSPVLPAVCWLALTGMRLVITDWVVHRLPHRQVAATFLGGLLLIVVPAAHSADGSAVGRAVLAAAAVYLVTAVVAVAAPSAMGGGDATLLGTVSLYLGYVGWSEVLMGLVLAGLLIGFTALVLVVVRRRPSQDALAAGPAVIGGALIALVLRG